MKNKLFFISVMLVSLYLNLPLALWAELPGGQGLATSSLQSRITLDIKGMDIVDVLKMLAQRAGMNIVVGKNVSGKVTLFLKDVETQDAFEIILLANDLAYEKKGEIINIMAQRDYELLYGERYQDPKHTETVHLKYSKAADLSKSLNQIKTNIGRIVADEGSNTVVLIDTQDKIKEMLDFIQKIDLPLETRVFTLNYAQADKIQAKIQEAVSKSVGAIRIDERTNKIAVTDYPEKLDELAKTIAAFDEQTAQVLIDAQIIEIKPTDKFEMGVNWDYWIRKYFEVKTSLPINTSNALILGTPSSKSVSEKSDYKAIMDILRTIGDAKILSSPRVMALNNQEARILVGQKDAYITSSTSQGGSGNTVTSQSVNFVDTGIKLYVTPTINKDGFVTMKIKPEVSSATRTDIKSEDKTTQIPIVSTSESETTVMVKDGVTIIMGGLKKESRDKTVKKIPILGDIPGAGFFFRSTTDEYKKTELVILLTPHILNADQSYTDFSEVPPKEGARAKWVDGNIVLEKISGSKGPRPFAETGSEYYYKIINDKIGQSFKSVVKLLSFKSPEEEKGEVRLSFILDSSGQLINEPKVASSSNRKLNDLAVKCLKNAAPFPPFPQDLKKEKESFNITLEYK